MELINYIMNSALAVVLICASIVGMIFWFARLESRTRTLEKEHEKSETTVWSKLDSLQESVNTLLLAVGELKGRIGRD